MESRQGRIQANSPIHSQLYRFSEETRSKTIGTCFLRRIESALRRRRVVFSPSSRKRSRSCLSVPNLPIPRRSSIKRRSSRSDSCRCIKATTVTKTKRNSSNQDIRWIDTSDIVVQFEIQSLFGKVIGPSFESLSNDQQHTDRSVFISKTKTPNGKFLVEKSYHYRHNLFVVWPKSQSSSITYCHGIHSLVDRWEQSVSDPPRPLADHQDLQQISRGVTIAVTLLCDKTLRDWSEKMKRAKNLVVRLLRLCTGLGAKRDGLALINLVVMEGRGEFEDGCLFNEEMGEAIVDFVCRVDGNPTNYILSNTLCDLLFYFAHPGWTECSQSRIGYNITIFK